MYLFIYLLFTTYQIQGFYVEEAKVRPKYTPMVK